jgi:hypothetical protein
MSIEPSEEPTRLDQGQPFFATQAQRDAYRELKIIHHRIASASGDLWMWPSMATTSRSIVARVLYWARLYEKILPVSGVICEFGVHWGTTSALLTNLRALYEPYNHRRKLYMFDTFEGFPNVSPSDGLAQEGDFSLPVGYEQDLAHLLAIHESLAPSNHVRKNQIYRGDASETVQVFLDEHPEAVIALAIFDLDLFEPTRAALDAIIPRFTKGSLIVFDELVCAEYPGETMALQEVLGLDRLALRRDPFMPNCAWATWE